jgi:transposase
LDAHVRNSFLYASDEQGGRARRTRIANTPEAFSNWRNELLRSGDGEVQPVRVVLESTTNSRALARLVERTWRDCASELSVQVLDARKLRIIADSVCKHDAVDARVLNELARSNLSLPTCYMPDDDEFALRELLRGRSDLVRIRTMLRNRVHAILHRRLLQTPACGLFTESGRRFLAACELDAVGRDLAERYLCLHDQLEQQIAQVQRTLQATSRAPRWRHSFALLSSMPGLGLVSGLTLLAELGDWRRFRARAAVANYAGLVPVMRSSNDKRYAGGITHRGPAQLRRVLTQSAWVAVRRVPAYQDLFERVAARRGKQVAIVGVARRMLEDAYTMLRKDESFRFVPVGTTARDPQVATSAAG